MATISIHCTKNRLTDFQSERRCSHVVTIRSGTHDQLLKSGAVTALEIVDSPLRVGFGQRHQATVGQNEPSNRCVQIDDDRASADSLKLAGSDYLSWHTERLP